MAVTFDGNNKIIIVDTGTTSLTTVGIYSDWKEWVQTSDNAKYLQAFTPLGGDPLPGSLFLGTTIFLENGWKIRPYEGNHVLDINGNLYSRDGTSPFISTIGNYNVLINLKVSNLVDTVSTGGGTGITNTDIQNIAANAATKVWDKPVANVTTANTMGTYVKEKILTTNKFISLKD